MKGCLSGKRTRRPRKLNLEAKRDVPDTAALRVGINEAVEHNKAVASYREHKATMEADQKVREKYAAMSVRILRLKSEREETILGVDMPVEGLGFDDAGRITFGGIPLDQASGAQKLRISMGIAMAAAPELRIIRITDGSLLDSKSLEVIRATAAKKDYQVWIESVDETGKIGVVIEDGEVVADNQSPPSEHAEEQPQNG